MYVIRHDGKYLSGFERSGTHTWQPLWDFRRSIVILNDRDLELTIHDLKLTMKRSEKFDILIATLHRTVQV